MARKPGQVVRLPATPKQKRKIEKVIRKSRREDRRRKPKGG